MCTKYTSQEDNGMTYAIREIVELGSLFGRDETGHHHEGANNADDPLHHSH